MIDTSFRSLSLSVTDGRAKINIGRGRGGGGGGGGGGYNYYSYMITLDGGLYIPLPVLTATNSLPAPRSMYPRYTNPDSPEII